MYSFKLCFNSFVSPQIRRVAGSAIEVSSYAKLVELCHSLYPKIAQYARKVLIKYVDNEGDEISADNEESFQGVHDYCKTIGNALFCLKLTIDFVGACEDAPPQCESPANSDQFVKVENPTNINDPPAQTILENPAIPPIVISPSDSVSVTSQPSADVRENVVEPVPVEAATSSIAGATSVAIQESVTSSASAALKEEVKATICLSCGFVTTNKCDACKVSYFCCTPHTVSECRDNCINRWKKSGIVFDLPRPIDIGTLVRAKYNSSTLRYKGFIADFDPLRREYSVKYDHGDFRNAVKANEIELAQQPEQAGGTSVATQGKVKETRCQSCGTLTDKKCDACNTSYFCSLSCTKRNATHSASECRDNCMKNWKAIDSLSDSLPGLPIGTLVSAKFRNSRGYYDGFIVGAGFDGTGKIVYQVKYVDGDFSANIYAEHIELRKPLESKPLRSPGVWDENAGKLTPQATAVIKEIFHTYSEDGVVEVVLENLVVSKQPMRFMSLTKFKLLISDFSIHENKAVHRLTDFYYKYASGIASNDVPALLEDGFIKHYTEEAKSHNLYVWYDIFRMGYDANLQKLPNNPIRKGEVVFYRQSVESDFEEAVVLNLLIASVGLSQPTTDFHIMLLKTGIEKTVSKEDYQLIRKSYDKCHKCRTALRKISLHSFCCCVNCEEPRADGSPIQSISI